MASTSSVGLLIVVLVIVVLGAISVALIAVGLRGRRIRPVCARCRFDVSGLVIRAREANDLATRRCPECGADLARAGAVRPGLRHPRRVPLALGISILSMLVSVGVLALTARMSHVGDGVSGEMPSGFDASVIDVIFEPDPMIAETDVDLREIAGALLRFEGVKVDWGDSPGTPP